MTSSKMKGYVITGVVALIAVAIANRNTTTRRWIQG